MITAHQANMCATTILTKKIGPMRDRLIKALNFTVNKKSNNGKFNFSFRIKNLNLETFHLLKNIQSQYESLGYHVEVGYDDGYLGVRRAAHIIYLDWEHPNENQKEGLNKW